MSGTIFVDAFKVWGFGFACGGVVGLIAGFILALVDEDARRARHRRRMERAAAKKTATERELYVRCKNCGRGVDGPPRPCLEGMGHEPFDPYVDARCLKCHRLPCPPWSDERNCTDGKRHVVRGPS